MTEIYPLVVAAVAGAFLAWKASHLGIAIREFVNAIKELSSKLDAMVPRFDRLEAEIRESAKGSSEAVRSIARSAADFENCVASFRVLVEPQAKQSAQGLIDDSITFKDLTYSFDQIQRDLLEQGIDPETAKYKAAEYELDRIAGGGDVSGISMSL